MVTKVHIVWCLLWLAPSVAFCATSGNTANFPENGKLTVGYEYTNVANRDIVEYDSRGTAQSVIKSSECNVGKISYGVHKNMAVDLLYGRTTLDIRNESAVGDPGMKFDTGDTWGVGLRIKLFEDSGKGISSGAGFQYQHFENDNAYRYDPKRPFSSESDEWHVSVDVAKNFRWCSVYSAARYSECTIPYAHFGTPETIRIGGFKETDNLGLAIGGEIRFAGRFSLCFEKRFLDEDAYSAGLYFRGW